MSKFRVAILVPFPTSNPVLLAHFGERVSLVTFTRHQVILVAPTSMFCFGSSCKAWRWWRDGNRWPQTLEGVEWCRWWYFTQLDAKGNGVNDFKIVLKHQNQRLWKPWGFGVRRRLWQGLKRGFPRPSWKHWKWNAVACITSSVIFRILQLLRVSIVDQRFLLSKSRCVLMIFQKGIWKVYMRHGEHSL